MILQLLLLLLLLLRLLLRNALLNVTAEHQFYAASRTQYTRTVVSRRRVVLS